MCIISKYTENIGMQAKWYPAWFTIQLVYFLVKLRICLFLSSPIHAHWVYKQVMMSFQNDSKLAY